MNQIKRNKVLFIIATALRTVALLCVTGPIMQTFLASIGFSSQLIYIHTSVIQAVNVLTISLCSTWADRGSVIKRTVIVELPYAVLYLFYIPLCIWKSPSIGNDIVEGTDDAVHAQGNVGAAQFVATAVDLEAFISRLSIQPPL